MLGSDAEKILREGAKKEGLAEKLPILINHAQEAILLESKVARAPLRIGQSRLAGRPDLPPNFVWPADKSGDFHFLAQINLSELPQISSNVQLPKQGHLYFFTAQDAFANDLPEKQVFYHPGNDLIAAEQIFSVPPKKMGFWKSVFTPRSKGLRLCELMFRVIPSLPQWNQPEYPAMERDLGLERDDESLSSLTVSFTPSEYSSKLLGFADQIQTSDLGFESQVYFEKIERVGNIYKNPMLEPQRKAGADWILLFQLSSDDNANMMWGDAGCLYFMIRKQELSAGRFSGVQLIVECF